MNALIDFFARQKHFADIMTVFIIVVGIYLGFQIRREAFPNINYDIITVTTIFPGSAPAEVEKLITNPLEQDLKEVDGIKKLTSVSAEGRSFIMIQLDPDQITQEQAKSDVQEVVDAFTDLPDGAEDPYVNSLESKKVPILEVNISGPLPDMELRNQAKILEREIETLPDVAKVIPVGLRDIEIRVEADLKKLARYQLTLDHIVAALKAQNLSIPGGTIKPSPEKGNDKEFIIRTIGELETVKDVENTVIRANDLGESIKVSDVARVWKSLEKTESYIRANGSKAISLTILKKERGDAITLVDDVKSLIGIVKGTKVDDRIEVTYTNDTSYFIRRRLNVLSNNLIIGLILVVLVLSLVLPGRVALVTAIGIPFAFLGTMMVFSAGDISLNLIAVMGLIIVLGMVVDDAIVVTENSVRLIQDGKDPTEASIIGTQQVWGSITASVFTTVCAFLPFMWMSGIFGKFVFFIPLGVISALIISLIECYFILPSHIGRWVKAPDPSKEKPKNPFTRIFHLTEHYWDNIVTPFYVKLLNIALKRRYLTLLFTTALFVGTLIITFKFGSFVLFPRDGVEMFKVNIDAPTGTSLEVTSKLIEPIEKAVKNLPANELENFVAKVGIQQVNADDPETKRGSEFAQVLVFLTPEQDRNRTAEDIIEGLRQNIGEIKGVEKLVFDRINTGPPVGKPISIGVRGQEYDEILPAVNELEGLIKNIPGVSDLRNNYTKGKEELHVKIDSSEAKAANLSVGMIGSTIRAAFEGLIATTIRTVDEEIDVRVTIPEEEKGDLHTIDQLEILNPVQSLIPLSRVSKIEKSQGLAAFIHEANQRQISVIGEIDEGKTTSVSVNNVIRKKLPEISKKHKNVTFHFSGEDFDTKESLDSLKRAALFAIFLVALILVMTFKNYTQPLLILVGTIPMGVMAVLWAFLVHSYPVTFLGLLGLVALSGVIVNNSIVFTSFVNELRENGMNKMESLLETGKIRIRPIFLTTITTVIGILPTAYGIGGLDKFVVPIALALGWGMFFGSLLTTLVFPASLAILDDIHDYFARKKAPDTGL